MTELSREILENYQMRNTKKQKEAFRTFLSEKLPGLQTEKGGLARSRNLILGDVDSAKVVFSAHYDTCTVLPFPNFLTPKNIPLYLLYNVAVCAAVFLLVFLASFAARRLFHSFLASYFTGLAVCFLCLVGMLAGKPNPHTANDNTSGVITLCELYAGLTEEQRKQAAFVFFDNEELGLLGSRQFLKRHKKQMKDKLLVNLDCVSDGDHLMLIRNKAARQRWDGALREAFCQPSAGKEFLWENSSAVLYPSDQAGFPCYMAVAAFNRSRVWGLYLTRIHTEKDTVFQEENIECLRESCSRLLG